MESNHSPAPWEFIEAHSHNDEWSASRPLTICSADNEDVANVFSHSDSTVSITRQQAIANAHLIAAAPDMLAALKHAALNMPHPDQMIDVAIAKAEGR